MSLWKRGLVGTVFMATLFFCSPENAKAQAQPTSHESSTEAPGPNADAKAYVDFGASNGAHGDLDGAISAFKTAINLDPKFAPAYYNLGYAKSLQNRVGEALHVLHAGDPTQSELPGCVRPRGNLKGRHGDFAGAIADFQQVVRIDPKFAPGYYNLGHVFYFTGDLDGASKQLDHALALDPNLPFAYFIRGLIRHAEKHNTDATADFRRSLGLNFPDAAFWVFICETEDGLGSAAQKDLTDALAKSEIFNPDGFSAAVGNFLLGHLPEDTLIAKADSPKEDEKANHTCTAWFYAGMSQRLSKNMTAARDCFTKAIATNSKGSEEYVEAQREMAAFPGL